MRKLVAWVLVTVGIAALVRRLKRRRDALPTASSTAQPDDPAGELRAKLDASRSEDSSPEVPPEPAVSERRAEVHDEGRAALDEMRSRETGD